MSDTPVSYHFSFPKGDEILELNGDSMAGLTHQDALQKFKVIICYQAQLWGWGRGTRPPASPTHADVGALTRVTRDAGVGKCENHLFWGRLQLRKICRRF